MTQTKRGTVVRASDYPDSGRNEPPARSSAAVTTGMIISGLLAVALLAGAVLVLTIAISAFAHLIWNLAVYGWRLV